MLVWGLPEVPAVFKYHDYTARTHPLKGVLAAVVVEAMAEMVYGPISGTYGSSSGLHDIM